MEINRRTDYAIRLVTAILQNNGRPLSVRNAAELQEVPYSFARSIQHDLVKSGLITTIRGARGGMVLAADPSKLTLTQLIETIQGRISLAICLSEEGWCPRESGCVYHAVWEGASEMLRQYLSSITLEELLDGGMCSLGNPS